MEQASMNSTHGDTRLPLLEDGRGKSAASPSSSRGDIGGLSTHTGDTGGVRVDEAPPPAPPLQDVRGNRIYNSGYSEHGANRTKPAFIKWYTSSKSPHEDISENVRLLRERSRDLYSGGGPLGRGAVDRVVLNALGGGLRLNVRIDPSQLGMSEEQAATWAAKTEGEFDYWASSKNADFNRELNFYELQVLALKSILIDGEVLMMLRGQKTPRNPYTLCVQLIESEKLETPIDRPDWFIDEGVELEAQGRVVAYYIANRHPDSEVTGVPPLRYARVPAFFDDGRRRIYHLFPRERIGQHRGVPFLAPVIEQLKQLARYTDAELMAAVVSGMFAIFFEHEMRPEGAYGEEDYAVDQGLGEVPGLENMSMQEMAGTMMELPEGVKATSISPGRPNQNFEQFVKSLAHQIGGCLGIPSELLFLNFTASYSASRGALLEAWKIFKYWRQWFSQEFCQAIYEEWLHEAVALGRVEAPLYDKDDYCAKLYAWCEWVGPSQGQLDPTKEVNAAVMRIANNLSTYQRECGELTGEDWDLVISSLTRERSKVPGQTNGEALSSRSNDDDDDKDEAGESDE